MGILTDPSLSQRKKFGHNLGKLNRKLCILLYIASLVWFCCLGHSYFNHGTYFSENALSPGLVNNEIRSDTGRLAQTFLDELNYEREKHQSFMPHVWIMSKMRQIGLEVHSHNFTLNYPLGGGKVFHGRNIYGILRAPRIASTEGIVFSTPYRPPDSPHTKITASVPILLAFAEFARRKNYWAKDLIFLITDQEQLGVHAWLQAYHRGDTCDDVVLNAGDLEARAGALQAAINLEIQDFDLDYIDVKLEGLNGQLPNLDLFNLILKSSYLENIPSGYKKLSKRWNDPEPPIKDSLKKMLAMLISQANGVPTGNHGHFHKYRIESVTLEGVKKPSSNHMWQSNGAISILRTIEGISRSLNNLLERFHQSFFFYILVSDKRFVSIGDFMPCLMLMSGALLIKAFLLWLNLDAHDDRAEDDQQEEIKDHTPKQKEDMQYWEVIAIYGVSVGIGILAVNLAQSKFLSTLLSQQGLPTGYYISIVLACISCLALFTPLLFKLNSSGLQLLHIATLVHTSTGLIVTGVLNFAFGIILSTFIVPLMIFVETKSTKLKWMTTFYSICLHPLVAVYLVVFCLTFASFNDVGLLENIVRAFYATIDSLTFAVVDQIIYNNWAYNTVAQVFFPAWILLWNVIIKSKTEVTKKLKTT